MNEAVIEAALVEQFALRADVVRQGAFAATNQDRAQEEMALRVRGHVMTPSNR